MDKKYIIEKYNIIEVQETQSTNTLAEELKLGDRDVVFTRRQTKGRGQRGNSWESEDYKNISITISIKPMGLEVASQFAVSMVVALACMDYVCKILKLSGNEELIRSCSVKWPNDIYVGNKKIGGILIEHSIAGKDICQSLCGIGLNINQTVFVSDAPNPVSLALLTNDVYNVDDCLAQLLACFESRYQQVLDYASLKEEFEKKMFRKDGIHEWIDDDGTFKGSIEGITEYGQLILRTEDGKRKIYNFKEVKFVGVPNP